MFFILYLFCIYLMIGVYFSVKILLLKEFHQQRHNLNSKELFQFFFKVILLWYRNVKFTGSKIMFQVREFEVNE